MVGAAMRAVTSSLFFTLASVAILAGVAIALSTVLFRLTIAGATSLYFVVWWTTLFAFLPIGGGGDQEPAEIAAGAEPGAPSRPRLREKAIWTTLASDLVFLLGVALLPLAGL